MYKAKTGKNISVKDINLVISGIIVEVIEENIPHKWIALEEPFENIYNGRISYDHSGVVQRMSVDDLKTLVNNYDPNFIYSSELDSLLSEIYIDNWTASYESNRGRNWICYKDLAEEKFSEWKYKNIIMWDEEGEYIEKNGLDMELVDIELDGLFEAFLKDTSMDLYYSRISKSL